MIRGEYVINILFNYYLKLLLINNNNNKVFKVY